MPIPTRNTDLSSAELKPLTVIPRDWKVNGGGSVPGAKVKGARAWIFIPGEQLRTIADLLHDRADELGL